MKTTIAFGVLPALAYAGPLQLVTSYLGSKKTSLPENFDTRLKWYGCGQQVYNQGSCGNCWAVSAITVLNDRMCIHKGADNSPLEVSGGGAGHHNRLFQDASFCPPAAPGKNTTAALKCKKTSNVLSPQTLCSCMIPNEETKNEFGYNITSKGCLGGEAHDAWAFFQKKGVSTMTVDGNGGCVPYVSGICGIDKNGDGCHSCNSFEECADSGLPPKYYKVDDWGWIHDDELVLGGYKNGTQNKAALNRQVDKMMKEIYTNGPIHACFDYYENFKDFFDYNPLGIYNSTENAKQGGGHCVTITGWGTDAASGMPYWLIRNSWSRDWGVHGYYRFLRGEGLSGLEELEVFAGCPEDSNCKLTDGVRPYPRDHRWVNGGGGGKWVQHDPNRDERAQTLARMVAVKKGINHDESSDLNVYVLETRVTSTLEARIVMTVPNAENGEEPEEHEAYFEYAGQGSYRIVTEY